MKENALKSLHTGGIPLLGYDIDPETKMLVINEKELSVMLSIESFVRTLWRLISNATGENLQFKTILTIFKLSFCSPNNS